MILHEGHRQRMYEKLENGSDLYDHELLEILLYSACPRINTNPIAHALLDKFLCLAEVFTADIEELKAVEGVGESMARFIKSVGMCALRAGMVGNNPTLRTFGDCKRFIRFRLSDKSTEIMELYFLDSASRVARIFTLTSNEKSRVRTEMDGIARNIAIYHPYAIVMAHNHINGTDNPSGYDDSFTRMIEFMCDMNGCILFDHLIWKDEEHIFSYRDDGRLASFKNDCNWSSFEKWITDSD